MPGEEPLPSAHSSQNGRGGAASALGDASPHPVLSAGHGVAHAIRFLDARRFLDLPIPWPRCQDIQDGHEIPSRNDIVVAVSHDWHYQTHPDPLGEKAGILKEQLGEIKRKLVPLGKTLLFLDFVSVPQRPFAAGQADRSPEEHRGFQTALGLMPRVYLNVDAIIHIHSDGQWVPGDGEKLAIQASDLEGASFGEIGEMLQVVAVKNGQRNGTVAPFDTVAALDSKVIHSLSEFCKLQQAAPRKSLAAVSIIKAPFGRRNVIPAGERGWIFLERFISMVKEAMLEETHGSGVSFSNADTILLELQTGASRLREAAKEGAAKLNEEMGSFFQELRQKRFAPTSTDAHGGGAKLHGGATTAPHADDASIVRGLMTGFVEDLQQHWQARMQYQRQRQLVLAVNRSDVFMVKQLLENLADPNFQEEDDSSCITCLHAAALHSRLGVAEVLVSYRADPLRKDARRNCPAHMQSYNPTEDTLQLFNLLAASREVLASRNCAGITVAKRFSAWAATSTTSIGAPEPFLPARTLASDLEKRYPDLFESIPSSPSKLPTRIRALRERIVPCAVKGRSFEVAVWEPARSTRVEFSVLYLAVGHAPWHDVAEKFAKFLAQELNNVYAVQLVAVRHTAFPIAPTTSLNELLASLVGVVDVLPLQAPCILLEDSMGAFVPALWMLASRFVGAFILNPWGFWDAEYFDSEAYQGLCNTCARSREFFSARDVSTLSTIMGTLVYASPTDLPRLQQRFLSAASQAPPEYFDLCALRTSCFPRAIYDVMKGQRQLSPVLPVVLAYGVHAPAMMQRSAEHYQKLVPGSVIRSISNSKFAPALEGVLNETQTGEVAALLCELLQQVAPQDQARQQSCLACWLGSCCA